MLSEEMPLANAEDLQIPRCAADANEGLLIIREHHARWQQRQRPLAAAVTTPSPISSEIGT
jgi:hypothetical protein